MQNQGSVGSKLSVGEAQGQFAGQLKNAIEQLNASQIQSDLKTEALVNGEIDDLHDVMITAQKASVTLNTAVEVQRKAIDAYNEIMRMQI
nr:flagellar hook-basal body complex protein FliE [Paraliobacillus quinghaiensis]